MLLSCAVHAKALITKETRAELLKPEPVEHRRQKAAEERRSEEAAEQRRIKGRKKTEA